MLCASRCDDVCAVFAFSVMQCAVVLGSEECCCALCGVPVWQKVTHHRRGQDVGSEEVCV